MLIEIESSDYIFKRLEGDGGYMKQNTLTLKTIKASLIERRFNEDVISRQRSVNHRINL